MKFLPKEHKSIKELIDSKGLRIKDFAFVKRKGKLYIQYQNNDSFFVLFRKTESVLDTNKNWTKKNTYQIYKPKRITDINSWAIVLKEFEKWLLEVMEL